jgi:hypothetical protein
VHQLRGDGGAVAVRVVAQTGEPRKVGIIGAGDLAGVVGAGGVGHRDRADQHEPGTAPGAGLEPRRLAIADRAVGLAEVGAHRAHGDPVAQAERPELPRREQVREVGHQPS